MTELKTPFTDSELLALLEVARTALQDADIFVDMAVDLDISDKEMTELREKLEDYLQGE